MELWKDSQLQTDIQIRLIYIYIQTWGKMELRIDSQLQTDRQLDRQIDIYTYIYKYIDNKHGKRWNNRKIVNYTQTNRQKIYMQLGTIDIYVYCIDMEKDGIMDRQSTIDSTDRQIRINIMDD